ncbi:hypothetical protein SNE40_009620 [Patella caerulea]|uniref:MADF domain-containing protein n=1 Tax=Patella caerulea TaxID=87958 RepID=A0AAN8JZE8_PATCE
MAEKWIESDKDRLIELWQQRPSLFDNSSKLYSNRVQKQQDYQAIALELEKPVAAVINQIKNLRTQFTRLIKCPASGSERKWRTVRQQWIVKQLEFLHPYIRSRETTSSAIFENDSETGAADTSATQLDEDDDDVVSQDLDEEIQLHRMSPTPSSTSKVKNKDGPYERQVTAKRKRDNEIFESIAQSLAKPIEIKDPYINVPEDEDDIFARLIAMKLKKIKDPLTKSILSSKMLQMLTEAEIAELQPTTAFQPIHHPPHGHQSFQAPMQQPNQGGFLTMLQQSGNNVEGSFL